MFVLRQSFVLKRLLNFNGLAGVDELVHVRRHNSGQITDGLGRSHELARLDLRNRYGVGHAGA